jgi:hypothetical protein
MIYNKNNPLTVWFARIWMKTEYFYSTYDMPKFGNLILSYLNYFNYVLSKPTLLNILSGHVYYLAA